MTPKYPDGLPAPLIQNYGFQHQETIARTQLVTGRAVQRKLYDTVPTMVTASWILKSDGHAAAFEAFFRDQLDNGAKWFEVDLKTPIGRGPWLARFTGMYSGPKALATRYWTASATLELKERPLLPPPWGEFPEFILFAGIIDYAVNDRWPLSPYQTDMDAFDYAVNDEWPQP